MDGDYIIAKNFRESNFSLMLGIEFTDVSEGFATGELEIREDHMNVIGSVHGGCLFSLADTIAGVAAASHGDKLTTSSGNFHFLSPALDCRKLIAEAKEIKNGRRTSVCDVDIKNENGKLLAKGTFSFYKLERI